MIRPFKGIFPTIHPSAYVEDSAHVIGDVHIGEDSSVWFGVVIRGDVNFIRIGRRTNVQDLSMLHVTRRTHPLHVGDEVTVGHSVALHGCTVGNRCLIGMGAVILDGAEIGDECIVGAGALVKEGMNVPPRSLVMGLPARVTRPLTDEEVAHLKQSSENYIGDVADYRGAWDPSNLGAAARLARRTIYRGKIVNLDLEDVTLPNGHRMTIEMIRHSGAAAVVPFLPSGGVVLIRQYRHAAGGTIYEVPAGRLDAGEDPEACARRELEEEAGYRAGRMERLATILTTPGFTDEKIHIFLARDLLPVPHGREPDEVIEVVSMPMADAIRKIENGEIVDGKTICALMIASRRFEQTNKELSSYPRGQ